MLRLVAETLLVAAIAFGGTLGPLTVDGLTAAEWISSGVAACVAALALVRQQPRR